MRRLSTVAGLVLVSLSFFPARADAVIWDWLDKLSGPSYKGFSVDWKVYCRASKTDAAGTYLLSLQRELTRDLESYREQRDSSSPPARVYFEYAVRAATVAIARADAAVDRLADHPKADVSADVQAVLLWRALARENAAWATKALVQTFDADGPGKPAPLPTSQQMETMMSVPGVGVTLSLCDQPLDRTRAYVLVSTGWGKNTNFEDFDTNTNLRLVTLGGSYHAVINSYFTIGLGAGVAVFSSSVTPSFQKLYVEPYLLDFRPFPHGGGWPSRIDWIAKGITLNVGSIMFPTGFEPGSFPVRRDRNVRGYPSEFVRTWGVNFDFEPLLQRWHK